MVSVLVLLNKISPTSIPFETTLQIAKQSPSKITVASFYDGSEVQSIEIEAPVEFRYFDADSRFDTEAWRQFYHELQTEDYDILHTHHNFTGTIARGLALPIDINIVNTEHRQHSSYTALQNMVNAPTLPLADKIVCNSKATKKSLRWYENLLLHRDQVSVIYNGVDISRINQIIKNTERRDGSPTVVTVGRHVPVKNYGTLLEAFRTVQERLPDVTLSLIGDGPLRNQLEAQAISLGISDSVQFKGQVSRSDVYRELGRADVFTIPSQAEGFCVAAVEAMAAGLPVVVSDIGVLHEVVGEPGVYADPNESAEFADSIASLIKDPQRRNRLGAAAKERAQTKFTLERTAQEYYKLYTTLAKTVNQ